MLGAITLAPVVLLAQNGATITGVVRDAQTDSSVANATIFLVGTLRSTTTNSVGHFQLPNLPPGRYTVRVAAIGHRADTASTGNLSAGAQQEVDFHLERAPAVLSGVVVTASRAPEQIAEAPVSVAVLPGREILDRNVTYLESALSYVPGVTFNGGGQLDIRGSTGTAQGVGSRVLVLLDGHPVLSADGAEIIWESLPLLDIQRVEVIKSAYSAIYGSNALGGVVNIITSPIDAQTETLMRVHYDAYQIPTPYKFTNSQLNAEGVQLQQSRTIGDVGTRFEIGREASDGYYQNGGYDRWFARAKVASDAESQHPWDAFAIWSRSRGGNFLSWQSDAHPFEEDSSDLGDRSVYNAVYTGAKITPITTSAALVTLSPYVNYNSNQDYYHTDHDYHHALKAGTNAQMSLQAGQSNAVVLGVDGAYTAIHSNFLGTPDEHDLGLYAQDEIALLPKLKLTAGGRFDYHNTTLSQAEESFNPKLALRYTLNSSVTLRASVGRGYRAPSAIEQFVSATQFGYHVIPNPELHGETAWSSEIGARATPWHGSEIDAALFQTSYQNLIGPAAAPDSIFVFQFRNVQRARVRGLDLGWNNTLVPDVLDVDLTYLYLDAIDTRTDQWLPYRSRHNVTATLELFRGLAGVDVRYRSRVESVLVYPLDPRSDITVVDLRANYRVRGNTVQLKVSNLFNKFYADVQERTPGEPRTLSLALLTPL